MRLLLDSHALYWWVTDSPRLSDQARGAILDPENEILASAVSYYELGLKQARGKLPGNPHELRRSVDDDGFREIPIDARHVVTAAGFRWRHRDPWDRILAAQGLHEDATLISLDRVFDESSVNRLW